MLQASKMDGYRDNGYPLAFPGFDAAYIESVCAASERIAQQCPEGTVFERDGQTVRSIDGPDPGSAVFDALLRDPRLLYSERQIPGGDVHIHRTKLNFKRGLVGETREWHQDCVYWEEDGMPAPEAVTAALFLDDVTDFSGPIIAIPGNHTLRSGDNGPYGPVPESGGSLGSDWLAHTSKSLKYVISKRALQRMMREAGVAGRSGQRGTVLRFHPQLVRSSNSNTMPPGSADGSDDLWKHQKHAGPQDEAPGGALGEHGLHAVDGR